MLGLATWLWADAVEMIRPHPLARMCGNPRLSRVVGCAMHSAPQDVPCHRVVNRRGELCAAFSPCGRETHRLLLEAEGVPFLPDGRVDLGAVLWPDTIL